MILSAASDLQTRQIKWVARKNDDSKFNKLTTDWGVSAVTISAQFADVFSREVRLPQCWCDSRRGGTQNRHSVPDLIILKSQRKHRFSSHA